MRIFQVRRRGKEGRQEDGERKGVKVGRRREGEREGKGERERERELEPKKRKELDDGRYMHAYPSQTCLSAIAEYVFQ